MNLYRIRGSAIVHSLALCSPLGRTNCQCIVARYSSLHNVGITLLCRHSQFGLLSCSTLSIKGFGNRHPAESVLRIDKLLLANSALSVVITRLPSHSNKMQRSRPCQLCTTRGLGSTTSDLVGMHPSAGLVVVKSFGSCPASGSMMRILRTLSPRIDARRSQLCRLLTQGTGSHGFNSCGCRNR